MPKSRVVNQCDKVTIRKCSISKHLKISKEVMPDEHIKGLNSYSPLLCRLIRKYKCGNLVAADVEHIFHIFFTLKLKQKHPWMDHEEFELIEANI